MAGIKPNFAFRLSPEVRGLVDYVCAGKGVNAGGFARQALLTALRAELIAICDRHGHKAQAAQLAHANMSLLEDVEALPHQRRCARMHGGGRGLVCPCQI